MINYNKLVLKILKYRFSTRKILYLYFNVYICIHYDALNYQNKYSF
jgi:hypothetical protein